MDKKSNKKYIFNIVLILSLGILVIYLTMKDDLKASLEALVNASPEMCIRDRGIPTGTWGWITSFLRRRGSVEKILFSFE